MTPSQQNELNGVSAEISTLRAQLQDKVDRKFLIESSFISKNFQPFGATTSAQEAAIIPGLWDQLNSLNLQIPQWEQKISDKVAELNRKSDLYYTPEEKQTRLNESQSALIKAQAEAGVIKADTENKLFVQKSTQWLIIGTVAVLIVASVAWFFRSKT